MFVLLVVGIALVAFGGVVLLFRPMAPGGKIAIGGFEISSTSAGLPLIGLGVLAILLSGGGDFPRPFESDGQDSDGEAADLVGEGPCFDDVPGARVFDLEAGVGSQDLLGPREPLDDTFVLHLTSSGEPVSELKWRFFPDNDLFKLLSAVDAECQQLTALENVTRGGDPSMVQNWDSLQFAVGQRWFALRLGEAGGILGVNYFREIAPQ